MKATSKISRNAPCPCQSGRKFKHCCDRPGTAQASSLLVAGTGRATRESVADVEPLVRAGHAQHLAGQLQAAESCYRRALALDPGYPEALHLLGMVAHQTGHTTDAISLIERAITARPLSAPFHNSLGLALRAAGKSAQAEDCFRKSIALEPKHAEAYANLGDSLRWRSLLHEAQLVLVQAVALDPQLALAHHSLAIVQRDLGLRKDAVQSFRRALELQPAWHEVRCNLAGVLRASGDLHGAMREYRAVLAQDPAFVGARLNLANLFRDLAQIETAVERYAEIIDAHPDLIAAHSNLLVTLLYDDRMRARHEKPALVRFARAAEGLKAANPTVAAGDRTEGTAPSRRRIVAPPRRLRIGYVSPDFRQHSVSHFIEPVLAHHDRDRVEVYCYYNFAILDGVTKRLMESAEHWRQCERMSDSELDACVRKDEIDILVDLAGHTSNHRLMVFARKPAPVQVTWIGYPGSTGLSAIDYQITDSCLSPENDRTPYQVEPWYRLPRVFCCYRAPKAVGEEAGGSGIDAPAEDRITFGSFNNNAKISDATVDTWARLLRARPDAFLLVKNNALADSEARRVLLERFAKCGIGPDRIEFLGRMEGLSAHLATYRRIDVALDTFPYCGVTTTCEALWMGTPVVTLAGSRFVSRTGVSLLSAVGHPEWIGASEDEYIDIALSLAADTARRAELRRSLRAQMVASPLMNEVAFTRDLESAYLEMWRRYPDSAEA